MLRESSRIKHSQCTRSPQGQTQVILKESRREERGFSVRKRGDGGVFLDPRHQLAESRRGAVSMNQGYADSHCVKETPPAAAHRMGGAITVRAVRRRPGCNAEQAFGQCRRCARARRHRSTNALRDGFRSIRTGGALDSRGAAIAAPGIPEICRLKNHRAESTIGA
jgi:hypothetical protein